MRRMMLVVALGVAWSVGFVPNVAAQGKGLADYGIVLLHGKGGQPGGNIEGMAAAMPSTKAPSIQRANTSRSMPDTSIRPTRRGPRLSPG